MTANSGYPSDLSDERWQLIEPVLTTWRAERRGRGLDIGRPPDHDLRSLMNAILYVDRTGVPWRYLPHDFPPWPTTYHYFASWQQDGVFAQLTGLLRHLVRTAEGRDGEPSACVLDSAPAENSIRAVQAACWYSWMTPPRRSLRRTFSWVICAWGSGSGAGRRGAAWSIAWWGRWRL